jgi:Low molecular weight phosphotyrosine protein phosphatase
MSAKELAAPKKLPAFASFALPPREIRSGRASCQTSRLRPRPRRFRIRTQILDSAKPPTGADGGNPARGESRDDEMTVGDALRAWSKARDAGQTPGRTPPRKKSIGVLFVGKDNSSVTVAAEAIFSDMVTRRASPSVRIFCYSAGTRVEMEGAAPDPMFIEGLHFKRGLDVSSHAAASVSVTDLETYDLIVCTGTVFVRCGPQRALALCRGSSRILRSL